WPWCRCRRPHTRRSCLRSPGPSSRRRTPADLQCELPGRPKETRARAPIQPRAREPRCHTKANYPASQGAPCPRPLHETGAQASRLHRQKSLDPQDASGTLALQSVAPEQFGFDWPTDLFAYSRSWLDLVLAGFDESAFEVRPVTPDQNHVDLYKMAADRRVND